MRIMFWICLLISSLPLSAAAVPAAPSPYGACSHLVGQEFKEHRRSMRLMRAAGIQWARADFTWSALQPQMDSWNFKQCDAILESAKKHNLKILPILDYNHKIANPAWQHLDKWEVYVRKTVERYQDQITVWEVWNEQNLENFWKDPNPENYLPLLKKSYEIIKSINPKLRVAVGGYSGVPFKYIEKLYQLGGGGYFDVMNVHPYSHPSPPENRLEEQLIELRQIMKKYGDADKPVWITEIGWPTHTPEPTSGRVLITALREVLPNKKTYRVICLQDPHFDIPASVITKTISANMPENSKIQVLDYEVAINLLDNHKTDALIMPLSENYYLDRFERVVRYVKEGGVVVDLCGMPFWYGHTKDENGQWRKTNRSSYHKLRVQPEAWWHKKGLIPKKMEVEFVGPAENIKAKKTIIADRFLRPFKFKEGDRFIPLLRGKTDKYAGVAAAIYDFNSDWKGAVIVNTLFKEGVFTVDEEEQARMLPRAQIIARRSGVERVFWYEFQAPEYLPHDKESHFGIVHKDFTEKPAYNSYRALTEQLPPGSVFIDREWRRQDKSLYYPQWTKADGTTAGAVWSFKTSGAHKLKFSGGKPVFTSYDGKPLTPRFDGDAVVMFIDSAPIYFQGAEITQIEKRE